MESLDWAFCTPVPGRECAGWAFYVAGKFQRELPRSTPGSGDPSDLREDIKFTEIVAATLSSLRQVGRLQRKQATLSHFFSEAVMGALESRSTEEALTPRLTDVSVLFCDLRGFSRKVEQGAEDLMGLLNRVSKALGVMTHHILDQGGAVGDFLGDAALGFWGWPIARQDDILRACLAALAIRQEFEAAAARGGHALADFRAGIGLATGRAVAGGIGTTDQLKVTVFGPVVNLASRLEGMTKQLHAPILVDETTARRLRDQLPANLGRLRRVAVVQPYGMDRQVEISELLPPQAEFPELTDEDLAFYEQGLDKFLSGEWTAALELLHRVPPRDRVKDFLTVYIAQNGRTPPADWKGVVAMTSKS
jgi:adenylate cyclase